MVAPIGVIDPLDDLLAPFMLEIDVDVGRFAAFSETKRSKSSSCLIGSMLVMPSTKQTQLLAATRAPDRGCRACRLSATMLFTVRK